MSNEMVYILIVIYYKLVGNLTVIFIWKKNSRYLNLNLNVE